MVYFLFVHNPNLHRVKKFFKSRKMLDMFVNTLRRVGPLDEKGKMLPVLDECKYILDSFTVLNIDEHKCPYYKRLYKEMMTEAEPSVYRGGDLVKYLSKNDPNNLYHIAA